MANSSREPFNVLVPPPVQRQIEALAGKRAGYQHIRKLLGIDPCHPDLKAYRLSGPLAPVVCGLHLKRGYRLAFTTQSPLAPERNARTQVVVLYAGKREPGQVDNPSAPLTLVGAAFPGCGIPARQCPPMSSFTSAPTRPCCGRAVRRS